MSGDQASGLRQWSQAHASREATRATPAELVVMTWEEAGAGTLAQRLALPPGVSRWQPRTLVLSGALPDTVPDAPWWVLQLTSFKAQGAAGLAEALRTLHRLGMPHTVLLAAPDHLAVAGLVSAAHTHLGVRLLQDARAWHQAVMAPPGPS